MDNCGVIDIMSFDGKLQPELYFTIKQPHMTNHDRNVATEIACCLVCLTHIVSM